MHIAFFDLDHTILGGSSGRIMMEGSLEAGLIRRWHLLRGLPANLLYRIGLMDAHTAISRWVRLYRGQAVGEMEPLALQWIETLKGFVRQDAAREIQAHQERGGITVILSATLPIIVLKNLHGKGAGKLFTGNRDAGIA
jgi:phosphoserine phosphatase